MSVGHAVHLHSSPELVCPYCGRREPLPADAAEQHRYIRLRLTQLERARLANEAPLTSYKQLKTAYIPAILFLGAITGWNLFLSLRHLGPGQTPSLSTLSPIALLVGLTSGFLGSQFVFGRIVRPLMQARPATRPGMPAQCRSCGGDLPNVQGAHATCPYCRADNLLGKHGSAVLGQALGQQAAADFARSRLDQKDPNVYNKPARAFYVFGALGALATLAALQLVLMLAY